jgi:hypothetical protein
MSLRPPVMDTYVKEKEIVFRHSSFIGTVSRDWFGFC